jgi:hypothetical protein
VLDLTRECPIPLAAACKLVPPGRNGERTHISTLVRWITKGVRSGAGQFVRLDALRLGSRWVTSAAALQRFAEALTPDLSHEPVPVPRSPGRRERETARAAARLSAAGI